MTAITVTAGHIAAGTREDCTCCPVALAILDTIPGITEIAVGPRVIGIKRGDGADWTEIPAPLTVAAFIWDFDDGGSVEPFTFDLNYPAVTP